MNNLGSRLKHNRLKSGLTLRELARQVNVSPSFISQIENGKSQPSVATLYAFSQLLNVSVDDLFEGKDDELLGRLQKAIGRTQEEIRAGIAAL